MLCNNNTIAHLAVRQAGTVIDDNRGELFSKAIGYTVAAVAGSIFLSVVVYFLWRCCENRKKKSSPV